jgi:hypothetical protein
VSFGASDLGDVVVEGAGEAAGVAGASGAAGDDTEAFGGATWVAVAFGLATVAVLGVVAVGVGGAADLGQDVGSPIAAESPRVKPASKFLPRESDAD